MSRVFICHATEDRPVAEGIVAALEEAGIGCWIAPRDVTAGADYAAAIVTALEDAGLVVLVLSPAANASPHVRREIERAASLDRTIVPIRLADVAPSKSLQYYVSDAHWYNAFPGSIESHLPALVDDISSQMMALGLIPSAAPAGPQEAEMAAVAGALAELTARYGPGLAGDPRRVRALLMDVAGESPTLSAAAVAASEIGVGDALRSAAPPMLGAVRVRLGHRLQRERALSTEMAEWAVGAWADALGLGGTAAAGAVEEPSSPSPSAAEAAAVVDPVPAPPVPPEAETKAAPPPPSEPVPAHPTATGPEATRPADPPAESPPILPPDRARPSQTGFRAGWWLAGAAGVIVVVGIAFVLFGDDEGDGAAQGSVATTAVPTTAPGTGDTTPRIETTEATAATSTTTSVATTITTTVAGEGGGDQALVTAGNPSFADPVSGAMVVDGFDDEWETRFLHVSSAPVFGESAINGFSDIGGGWRLAWDETYLYFYVTVVDDVIVQENTGPELFRGDAVAFYFDGDLSDHAAGAGLNGDDVAFFIAPTGPSGTPNWVRLLPVASGGAFGAAGAITSDPGVEVAVDLYTGGYAVEGKVAWDVLLVEGGAEAGDVFRMTLDVSDNDDPGTSRQQSMISNSPGRTVAAQARPEVWEVLFLDNPQLEFFAAAPAVFGLDGDLAVDILERLGFSVFTVADTCGAGTADGTVYRVSAGGGQQLDGPDVDPQPVVATNLLLTVFITDSAEC